MARIELRDSGVVFNKENHTYELNGVRLSGITDMLHRQLYPNEFENVPVDMVKQAGLYGSNVHDSCEDFDKNYINDGSVEVQDYMNICKENNLVHELSEYTVTDGKHWASNIDKVYRMSDDTFDLADIKTYGKLTPDKLNKARWQLSVYAYFMELVNKKAKVSRLLIIHIRNKEKKDGEFDHIKEIVEVQRIPSDIVKELLSADEEGRQFLNPYDIPGEYAAKEERIRELLSLKESIEGELSGIKSEFQDAMTRLNICSWTTESGMRITRKQPTTRSSFNLPLFKKDNPEIDYGPYMKVSNVSGSLTITV